MNSLLHRFLGCSFCAVTAAAAFASGLPAEPVHIGTTPQFFVDDYLVDNRWALKQKREAVLHVFHPPRKHPLNPVIAGEGGFVQVVREADTGRFKMWYQTHEWTKIGDEENTDYAIAYAESADGLKWTLPKLGLHTWNGGKDNNIVWKGFTDARASGAQIVQLPEQDKRGFRYVMTYRTAGAKRGNNGIRLVGSQDGIHWDKKSDTLICELASDTLNSIVHDPVRGEYVMYCRAKHLYRLFQGDIADTGESRRIARLASKELWTKWEPRPQNVLLPDDLDARENFNAFYGMPARVHAGIYWGALWVFRFNDNIYTELVTSRDGMDFDRAPGRAKMIALGADGAWDDGMTFGSADWVEVGDEWWIYYSGWDGDHGGKDRKAGIGLVTLPKERFVSLRGPAGGGVVVTRQLIWPGGKLLVNADASKGELKVRISGDYRKPLEGFDYANCVPIKGDSVAQEVKWNGKSMAELKGKPVRIEFQLQNADLFTFRATGE